MSPHFNNAGRYYPKLIVVVVVSAVAMILWQILSLMNATGDARTFFWSAHNYLVVALSFVATLTLIWRVAFALIYKPFTSVHDALLPKVTVVIPAYNEGSQVLSTVRSIMASRYPMHKMQVICVDDGSQDDT